jgi:hypothetical protein
LLLPVTAYLSDPRALAGDVSAAVEACARVLIARGYEVRIKLHPGLHEPAYFEALCRDAALPCEVSVTGTLRDHLDWADLVVGPIASNAAIETLSAGKPYIPLCPNPTAIDHSLVASMPLVDSAAALDATLAQGWRPNMDDALEELCATTSVPDPSARFWRALETARG